MKALTLFCVLAAAKVLAVAGRELPWSLWTPLALFWQDALVALLFGVVDFALRRKPRVSWILFWLIVTYTAVNVPLARILSSPFTWQMSQATGGALADSITHYFTLSTVIQMIAVIGVALGFAILARRFKRGGNKVTPHERRSRRRQSAYSIEQQNLRGLTSATTVKGFTARTVLHRLVYQIAAGHRPALRQRPIEAVLISCTILALLALVGALAAQRVDCSGFHRNAIVAFVDSALPHVRGTAQSLQTDWRAPTASVEDVDDLSSLVGAAQGRNVVLISLESTGARYLRCYGAKDDPMPNLTRLAESSIIFDNAYAVTPESIKGLFSVLCSRYPAFDTSGEDYASARTPSLAQRLADEDYRTALFHSGRFMYLGMNAVVQQRGFNTLEDAGAIGGNYNSSFGVDEPATVERMLEWIDALPHGQRFFLHYLPIAGHHPYQTPERGPFPESNDASQYLNALHYGDAALGKFLDALRERGLDTNTLFVFYGDHGEAFGQHDGNFGHTLFLYDENVHVPLLIAMPCSITNSRRVERMASLVDLAPSILDLLGLATEPDYQGTSLLANTERAALFFTDYSLPLAGVRDGKWKLITELGTSRAKLFDVETDPLETRNLAGQHRDFVTTWQARLHDWASAQKALITRRQESIPGKEVARAVSSGDHGQRKR